MAEAGLVAWIFLTFYFYDKHLPVHYTLLQKYNGKRITNIIVVNDISITVTIANMYHRLIQPVTLKPVVLNLTELQYSSLHYTALHSTAICILLCS